MPSLRSQKWRLKDREPVRVAEVATRLLTLRGINPAQAAAWLAAPYDPYAMLELKDLAKATERVKQAISAKERILICGDYDADGVTGSALLYLALRHAGAEVSVRLPHRLHDGYGLSQKIVAEAAAVGAKLLITVDNGISCRAEVTAAKEAGMEVVITDHHLPPAALPAAYAIVNPRQADCTGDGALSGAGVALKLALSVLGRSAPKALMDELLTLATLGTVADICPLLGENRALVRAGLACLATTQNTGLQQIMRNANIDKRPTEMDIGYRIGPRLNAAGRVESALTAWQALTHPTRARDAANQLEELNLRRRQMADGLLTTALAKLHGQEKAPVLIASSADWHAGVIGLTAGRLAERYYRPVILAEERGEQLTASCRSPVPELNITEVLTELADDLISFGGHRAAAGFTAKLANKDKIFTKLQALIAKKLEGVDLTPTLELDLALKLGDITPALLAEVQKLAPYGAGNPEPVFLLRELPTREVTTVGATKAHLKLPLGGNLSALGWSLGDHLPELRRWGHADAAVSVEENLWNGNRTIQLRIHDLRPSREFG